MNNTEFEKVLNETFKFCEDILCAKSKEYSADTDRLHNFNQAGYLQQCTSIKALGGMMAKHTISVYDLIERVEQGFKVPAELWDEKIIDSINYLILLRALVREDAEATAKYIADDKVEQDKPKPDMVKCKHYVTSTIFYPRCFCNHCCVSGLNCPWDGYIDISAKPECPCFKIAEDDKHHCDCLER